MNIQSFLEYQLLGNAGQQWLLAIATFVGLVIVFKIFSSMVIARLKKASEKTETDIDDFFIGLVNNVKPPFYFFVALYAATQLLELNGLVGKIIFGLFLFTIVYQAITILQRVIDYGIQKILMSSGEEDNQDKEGVVKLIGQIAKAVLWVVGALMIFSNFGIDVTSLIAGLGIGGIAIALALQNVLGDLFASFSIFLDKPFKVGDYISISPTEKGTVEKVGIKTTRVRTLQGQQLVVSNKKLTDSSVENFRRMDKRRMTFVFGVVYETPIEKLKAIPSMITDIIESVEKAKLDRVNFKTLGASSLDFEVVFTMQTPEYPEYMNAQEKINFAILEKFEKEKIEFAYPTQTLFVKK
ncbi:mechanosensitive ion channel family protein [bacterium]|jgi:small-conductance mechanosensitive channel|nr:mechanosensitive ion channel family protein [bacterium]